MAPGALDLLLQDMPGMLNCVMVDRMTFMTWFSDKGSLVG
jgi:hypothetical protein